MKIETSFSSQPKVVSAVETTDVQRRSAPKGTFLDRSFIQETIAAYDETKGRIKKTLHTSHPTIQTLKDLLAKNPEALTFNARDILNCFLRHPGLNLKKKHGIALQTIYEKLTQQKLTYLDETLVLTLMLSPKVSIPLEDFPELVPAFRQLCEIMTQTQMEQALKLSKQKTYIHLQKLLSFIFELQKTELNTSYEKFINALKLNAPTFENTYTRLIALSEELQDLLIQNLPALLPYFEAFTFSVSVETMRALLTPLAFPEQRTLKQILTKLHEKGHDITPDLIHRITHWKNPIAENNRSTASTLDMLYQRLRDLMIQYPTELTNRINNLLPPIAPSTDGAANKDTAEDEVAHRSKSLIAETSFPFLSAHAPSAALQTYPFHN